MGESVSLIQEEQAILAAQIGAAQKILEIASQTAEVSLKTLEREEALLTKRLEKGDISQDQYDAEIGILQEINDVQENLAVLKAEGKDITDAEFQAQLKILEAIKDKQKGLIKSKKLTGQITAATTKTTEKFKGLFGMTSDLVAGPMMEFAEQMGHAYGSAGQLKVEWNTIGKVIGENVLGAVASLAEKVVTSTFQFAFAADNAVSSFVGATGASRQYEQVINQIATENVEMGVSIEASAKAVEGLYENFTDFTTLGPETEKNLVRTSAYFTRAGVSAQEFGVLMQEATRTLGMSAGEAGETIQETAERSMALGITPKTFAKNLQMAMPRLAAFGTKAIQVFERAQEEARRMGMEMGEMLNITDRFNTFDTAAESVGSLNAILGGSMINSMDLVMETDPTKRIEMLRKAINSGTKSFKDFSYYERLAAAEAMGLGSNVDQLNKVMNRSQAELRAEADEQRRLEQVAKDATSAQQQLILQFQQFASSEVAGQIISAIKSLASGINWLAKNVGAGGLAFMGITAIAIKFGLAIKAARAASALHAAQLATSTAVQELATAAKVKDTTTTGLQTAAERANTTQKGVNTVANDANTASTVRNTVAKRSNMMAGAALLAGLGLMAAGIGAAAAGFGYFAEQINKLPQEKMEFLRNTMIGLGVGFGVLAIALATVAAPAAGAAGPLLALGASVLMIGAGLALATLGLAAMFASLSLIPAPDLLTIGLGLISVGAGIWAIASASTMAVPALVPMIAVLGVMTIAAAALALVVNMVAIRLTEMFNSMANIDPLNKFVSSMKELGVIGAGQVALAMASIAEGIESISEAMEEVGSLDKLIQVSYAFERMGNVTGATAAPSMTASANIVNENMRTLTAGTTAAGDRVASVRADITSTSIDNLANKLATVKPGRTTAAAAPSGPPASGGKRTVVLELNGKVLAKALADLDAEYNDLRAG